MLMGFCQLRRMRSLEDNNLKKLAQRFQILSEILEGYFYLFIKILAIVW